MKRWILKQPLASLIVLISVRMVICSTKWQNHENSLLKNISWCSDTFHLLYAFASLVEFFVQFNWAFFVYSPKKKHLVHSHWAQLTSGFCQIKQPLVKFKQVPLRSQKDTLYRAREWRWWRNAEQQHQSQKQHMQWVNTIILLKNSIKSTWCSLHAPSWQVC